MTTIHADEPKRGDRLELVFTSDRWTNLRPGDRGTVTNVDDAGTVHVRWDNGSSLGLIPGQDQWTDAPMEE